MIDVFDRFIQNFKALMSNVDTGVFYSSCDEEVFCFKDGNKWHIIVLDEEEHLKSMNTYEEEVEMPDPLSCDVFICKHFI